MLNSFRAFSTVDSTRIIDTSPSTAVQASMKRYTNTLHGAGDNTTAATRASSGTSIQDLAAATTSLLSRLECQFRGDLDGWFQRSVDGTAVCKDAVHPLGGFPLLRSRLQVQHDVNACGSSALDPLFPLRPSHPLSTSRRMHRSDALPARPRRFQPVNPQPRRQCSRAWSHEVRGLPPALCSAPLLRRVLRREQGPLPQAAMRAGGGLLTRSILTFDTYAGFANVRRLSKPAAPIGPTFFRNRIIDKRPL